MNSQSIEWNEIIWIILPVILLYPIILIAGLVVWYRNKDNLGQYKFLWLFIILIFSIIGPLSFLLYAQLIMVDQTQNFSDEDDWSD